MWSVWEYEVYSPPPQLVLLMGNYMNAGSRNAQSFGFELSYLTKVGRIGERLEEREGREDFLHPILKSGE